MHLYHTDCHGTVQPCRPISPGERPDPDRYGNLHIAWRCQCCGETSTVVHEAYGGTVCERDFEFSDRLDWLIPL